MEKEKGLGRLDIVCGIICAILFADVLISNTSVGPSVIVWWLIIGVVFFIPNGLVTAELTGAYPEKGGIYGWVDKAFGSRWAGRLSWLYWINCALWMPSGFIWFSGALCGAFFPEMGYLAQVAVSIGITWITVFVASMPMTESKWIVNLGGVAKVLIFLAVGACGVAMALQGNPPANELSAATMMPTLDQGLQYLPVIVYCCCGLEVLAMSAHEMKNPSRDLPKAVIGVVILAIAMNVFASWGVLQTVPLEELDLVTGIGTVASVAFGSQLVSNVVLVLLLFGVFVQMITWSIAGSRGAAEAGQAGELPAVFGRETKRGGMPVGALVISGIVSTVTIVVYGFMAESASDLFFTLLAFSSIIFFMPYVIMFAAYIRLKKADPDVERPFKAPCGVVLSVVCTIVLIAAMVLFVWVPGQPFDAAYGVPILVGLALTLGIGELMQRRLVRKRARVEQGPDEAAEAI
ncbi:APC family permease [Arabiibacter massiliensis]|uniref:APC family permease n=1 Tax=Arabiibacter massiliensis TaxID=1870985 RepID=UPI0009BBEF13|nr:APC family permease [Arabiibacter massiliensis]